ncbi:MAG TPA: HD domain-containing protein [Ktedonobacterales bacterium]|jgi:hypothetical protein
MQLPFMLETPLEEIICASEEWQRGAAWGRPRRGHPEGQVAAHIAEVLANVERHATSPEERADLRLIALIHDTFKYRVDTSQPAIGDNHHATIACRFAERYLEDRALLEIIELHDEAYNSFQMGERKDRWQDAEERALRLVQRLGASLPLYVRFYRCDNGTGSKTQAPVIWFEELLRRLGYPVPAPPAQPPSQQQRGEKDG